MFGYIALKATVLLKTRDEYHVSFGIKHICLNFKIKRVYFGKKSLFSEFIL